MSEIRLIIRCKKEPDKHAKILQMQGLPREVVEDFAGLLCGTSPYYIHNPGPDSPIGKCVTCGGQLTYEIEERDAEPKE